MTVSKLLTGEDYEFTAFPKAGYEIQSVIAKVYNLAGTEVATTKTLTSTDGKYKLEGVKSYTEVTITASAISDTVAVKISGTSSANAVFCA